MSEFILIGVFAIGFALGCVTTFATERNKAGYQECISELPRNQYCKLIAVPDNQE